MKAAEFDGIDPYDLNDRLRVVLLRETLDELNFFAILFVLRRIALEASE